MTLASQAPSTCEAQFGGLFEMLVLAPFAGYRLLGYYMAGVVLDLIDSDRPPLRRTPGQMSQMRETAR